MRRDADGKREAEIKKYAKIEKIPGGDLSDCRVLDGVMFNKDVVNPSRMARRVEAPRVLLLDCPVEYKKGENQTAVELTRDEDFAELLRQEEEVPLRASALRIRQLRLSASTHTCGCAPREVSSRRPPCVV